MNMPDFRQAFAPAPADLTERIEEAFERGEREMRKRYKITLLLSAAAVLAVACGIASLATGMLSAPAPDVAVTRQETVEKTALYECEHTETYKVYDDSLWTYQDAYYEYCKQCDKLLNYDKVKVRTTKDGAFIFTIEEFAMRFNEVSRTHFYNLVLEPVSEGNDNAAYFVRLANQGEKLLGTLEFVSLKKDKDQSNDAVKPTFVTLTFYEAGEDEITALLQTMILASQENGMEPKLAAEIIDNTLSAVQYEKKVFIYKGVSYNISAMEGITYFITASADTELTSQK